ncbi:hypothetical protein M231_03644 [Tremella mesenterica]|uniref:Uncharacterized protein n=1 Tax=Tremella mesenterica TaxID=5217 RepID=A0A4Q1BMR4_TREME|nr:uncharacterized protein TREMEDRAFT_59425 [Tremella mesenterica DSM 1558]EIW73258.1 hypothetical protein TREMEDRAFT_59425 [Tremella mesenterica DSM 1558]RXK39139.1 hypothetical protein M231_03644 [Tremella mesenterica]
MTDLLVPPRPMKRARSSSPPLPDLQESPLNYILKKQRRDTNFTSHLFQPCPTGYPVTYPDPPESSTAHRKLLQGVERRRTRQWEFLNAPSPHLPSHPPLGTTSQPSPQHGPSSDNWYPSPIKYHSQPEFTHMSELSSSPIRHQPPSSSPFRPSSETVISSDTESGMEIEIEDMMKEWGEEYASQNSLLHNLHRSRNGVPIRNSNNQPETSSSQKSHHHLTTPYRNHVSLSSSPYPSTRVPASETDTYTDDDEMDGCGGQVDEVGEEAVRKRYEEANRLLAELEVVRRQRWGQNRQA